MTLLFRSVLLCAFSVLCLGLPTYAGPINVGGSYNVSGTNFPVNFGPTAVTLDANPHFLAGGALQVQAEVEDVDTNNQFIEWTFSTTAGGAIAGNLDALWNFTITDIPVSQPTLLTAFYYYWTVNGQPVQNIQNWVGGVLFDGTGINPRNPADSPVFGGFANPPAAFPINPQLFVNPFSFISTMVPGGIDPSTINDFHIGLGVRSANPAVPEPTGMTLFGLTALGLAVAYRRRASRRAPAEQSELA